MTKVHNENGYDFYVGVVRTKCDGHQTIYNIVPEGQTVVGGGYPNRRWIEKVKGVKFPDRYQPTKHGMRETYLSDDWSGVEKD